MWFRLPPLLFALVLAACSTSVLPALDAGTKVATDAGAEDLFAYYAGIEARLLAEGRMRRERDPLDAPYTTRDLVRNFDRIALFDEYRVVNGRYVQAETESTLRRWSRPVRVGIIFGDSVPAATRADDEALVRGVTGRLSALTGLDMRLTGEKGANFLVMFLDSSEQKNFAGALKRRYPFIEPAVIDAFRNSPKEIFCVAYAFAHPSDVTSYAAAIVLVKAEHGARMRESCVEEEMAQAMGLANDSRTARPSIFNDDEEFARLTRHDEILLRMLYDPRLRPGMTRAEALPYLPTIAAAAAGAS
jgi:hypothetical protein